VPIDSSRGYDPEKHREHIRQHIDDGEIRFEYRGDVQEGDRVEEAIADIDTPSSVSISLRDLKNVRREAPWATAEDPDYDDYDSAPPEAVERFRDRKVGIRIHWGVYSELGATPSWSLWPPWGQEGEPTPEFPARGDSDEEFVAYQRRHCTLYQDFDPTAFDAAEWADLFDRAGLQFAVLTTKHHDGFALFDTDTVVNALRRTQTENGDTEYEHVVNHYSIADTPYSDDIVDAFVDAMRERGLGVGLYFSHPDWMDFDARFGQVNLFRDPAYTRETHPECWEWALERHREQLRELTTEYGDIDMLSVDNGLPRAAWPDLKETMEMVRENQPDVMIRSRSIGAWGDYFTPEGWHPESPYADQIFGKADENSPWTAIGPTGRHPGYSFPDDQEYPPVDEVIEDLVVVVAAGGTFQIGLGPGPDGAFDDDAVALLEELGEWLDVNGEAIYATRPRDVYREGDVWFTRSKDRETVYVISLDWPGDALSLDSVSLREGAPVHLLGREDPLDRQQDEEGLTVDIPRDLQDPEARPCEHAYAFRIPNGDPVSRDPTGNGHHWNDDHGREQERAENSDDDTGG
jgi:alpha-L-fucosidase